MKNNNFLIIYVLVLSFIVATVFVVGNDTSNSVKVDGKCVVPVGGNVTISFDTDGGSKMENVSFNYSHGEENIKILEPTKKGYFFDGWYLDKSLTKQFVIKTTLDVPPTAVEEKDSDGCQTGNYKSTLYAKWSCMIPSPGGSTTIQFETNGGEKLKDYSICIVCAEEKVELPVPKKEGYKFEGWYADKKLTNRVNITSSNSPDIDKLNYIKEYYDDEKKCPSGSNYTILYANWTKVETKCPIPPTGGSITLLFETNGGEKLKDYSICTMCADEKVDLPIPKREGYKFEGWYADKSLTKKLNITSASSPDIDKLNLIKEYYDDNHQCPKTSSHTTIYAKWSKDSCPPIPTGGSMTIHFDTNGGDKLEDFSYCSTCAKEKIKLPEPTRKGYIFMGWYFDEALTMKAEIKTNHEEILKPEPVVDSKGCLTGRYQTTLYAKWGVVDLTDKVIVSYETNGGVKMPSEAIEYDKELPTPTRAGYEFEGWYIDKEFTVKVSKIVRETTEEKDIVLYAKWIEIENSDKAKLEAEAQEKSSMQKKTRTNIIILTVIGVVLMGLGIFSLKFVKIKRL